MDKRKALEIIQLNKAVLSKVKKEYSSDMYESKDMLDIHYIRKTIKLNPEVYLFDFPMKNEKVGAIACTIRNKHYIMLNSKLPKGEKNYHLVHDYYHITHEHSEDIHQLVCEYKEYGTIYADVADEPHRNEIEKSASLYASLVLLPEKHLKEKFDLNRKVYEDKLLPCICEIMSENVVPYTLTVIRLRELEIITEHEFDILIEVSFEEIKKCFTFYGIDGSCIESSSESNYSKFEDSVIDVFNSNNGEIVDYAIKILTTIIQNEIDVNDDE